MSENQPLPQPDEVNRQIVQRMKTLLVIDSKITRLQQIREAQQKEIDRLLKLT